MEFAGKGEVQAFLEKVKKNPFLRIMLMFLAPLGLMMARAEGNEMMIMFWEELLGQRDGQEGANSSAGGRAG